MASKNSKKDAPQISASMQWTFLGGLAVLAVVAIFVFGIGTSDTGVNHGGLINLINLQ